MGIGKGLKLPADYPGHSLVHPALEAQKQVKSCWTEVDLLHNYFSVSLSFSSVQRHVIVPEAGSKAIVSKPGTAE